MGLVFCTFHQICLPQQQVSMLNEHPCAQVPLDYTGYAPELSQ